MSRSHPLAIIGMGCMFPKARDGAAYWVNLREGVDAITEVPETHWRLEDYFDEDQKTPDMTYGARGGFLEKVDFDPLAFGIAPKDIEATDTTQLFGLLAARKALDDAGYGDGGREYDRERVSVVLGVTGALELVVSLGARLGHPLWKKALRDAGVDPQTSAEVVERISEGYVGWQENSFPGLLGNVAAGRIANRLDLHGTNCVVDAACASSLSALHLAALELETGRADLAITGGIDTFNDIFMYMCFSKTPALSPTGDARPFDANGDGTVLGEGVGMVVLKRLDDAERDGDRVYAVLKGIGSSSDGKGDAVYAPSRAGQARALRRAFEDAGVEPSTIELVEAHGTGTRVGDAVELDALNEVFRDGHEEGTWCALGSVKSMIGHTKAAAGAAGLIKAALALHHKVLPPTLKVTRPAAALEGDTPFYLNTVKRPWLPVAEHPRRAGVSAFGFGGSNFHAVLEEYGAEKTEIDWDGEVQLFAFGADDRRGLLAVLESFETDASWSGVRGAAAQSRASFDGASSHRILFAVERGGRGIGELLTQALGQLRKTDDPSWSLPSGVFYGSGPHSGDVVALFPGQGAQYVGMGRDLACQFPGFLDALARANVDGRLPDSIYPHPAFDDRTRTEQANALRRTDVAQPALGAISMGYLSVLRHFGVDLRGAVGHSYGELTALTAAGRLTADELVHFSRRRGELMASGEGDRGSMLAVVADAEAIAAFVTRHGLDLVLANRNSPTQGVLSGATAQIERAEGLAAEDGLRHKRLDVAAAFHSEFVAGASDELGRALRSASFEPARFPVWANTTGEPYPEAPADAQAMLARQLAEPVDFVRCIENAHAAGARTFVEVGPGRRLSGLVDEILDDVTTVALDASAGQRRGQLDLARALGQLASCGVAVDLTRWDEGALEAYEAELSLPKPRLTVPITGANYVAPRPPRPRSEPRPRSATNGKDGSPGSLDALAGRAVASPPVAANPKVPMTRSKDPGVLAQAIRTTQESLDALVRLQEQTGELHRQFLAGQEQATRSYEALVAQQQAVLLGTPMPAPATLPAVSVPSMVAAPGVPAPVLAAPVVAAPVVPPPVAPAPTPVAPAAATPVASSSNGVSPAGTDADHVARVLLAVVAEKTGYPAEMLELEMGLDGDLGIDSIKRVEILSALGEQLPDAPEVKPEHLGTLQTLGQIVEFLAGAAPTASPAVRTPGLDTDRVAQVLLGVVAEKTGYPVEMLELEMGLDGDLGIDSIKRVEILSALTEQLPEAPEVKPEHLGTLQTLGEIVTFLAGGESPRPGSVAPTPPSPSVSSSGAVVRYVLERRAVTLDPSVVRLQAGDEVWITDTDDGLSDLLATQLRARDLVVSVVAPDADLEVPADLAGLVLLASRGEDGANLSEAFSLLRRVAPTLGARPGALVASVSRLDGSFGLGSLQPDFDARCAGLAGLVKSAHHEWPEAACVAIDLARSLDESASTAQRLAEVLLAGGPLEVGLDDDGLWSLELVRDDVDLDAPLEFDPEDVVVVTGGARGVTAEVALAFVEAGARRLALFGRSPLPTDLPDWATDGDEVSLKRAIVANADTKPSPKEVDAEYRALSAQLELRRNVERLRAAGAKVSYHAVDVRDADAVGDAVRAVVAEFGPVTVLVHGAGVLADSLIQDKSDDDFDRVFRTKVDGARHLLAATADQPLRALAFFSSSTARFGRRGQADYAAANEVLNKMAVQEALRRPEARVVSVNWGPWDGGMVTAGLKKMFADEGICVIGLREGAQYLLQELGRTGGPVETVVLGAGSRLPGATRLNGVARPPPKDGADSLRRGSDRTQVGELLWKRRLDLEHHAFLRSHVIDGKGVLPLSVMLEWLAHGAMLSEPTLRFCGFENLRVLQGVRVGEDDDFEVRVERLSTLTREHETLVTVQLVSGENGTGMRHASADIVLGKKLPVAQTVSPGPKRARFLPDLDEVYGQLLFHGPLFQTLREIEGCDDSGIRALAQPAPPPAQWLTDPPTRRWISDPLAIDAAFQLMILWSRTENRIASLPSFAASYRQYRSAFPYDGVRIEVRITARTQRTAQADIDWLDNDGALVARLTGYECTIDPLLDAAFARNQIEGTLVARS